MILIAILALMLFFYIIFRMMWLSYMIEHLRAGGTEETLSQLEVFGKIAITRINNHLLPGPYFSEFHDTDEIKEWIGKRNRVVALFWALAILGILAQFFFHPLPTKTTTH